MCRRIATLAATLLTLPLTALADDGKAVPEVFGSRDPNLPEFI